MSTRLLDASTRKPLLEIVEQQLLQPHLAQLIERGFKVSVSGNCSARGLCIELSCICVRSYFAATLW